MFLDKLSLGEQVFCFNKGLLTNFINNQADKMAQKCLKIAKRGKNTGKLGKKAPNHDTYAKPISTNKIVLQFLKYDSYKPKQEKIIDYIKTINLVLLFNLLILVRVYVIMPQLYN